MQNRQDCSERRFVPSFSNQRRFGFFRCISRLVAQDTHECVEPRIQLLDLRQMRVYQFQRRKLPRADQAGHLRQRQTIRN